MRSYQQFCPVARALDAVGERWTLLVVRELLAGPKRYTDLQEGLPGIGPNVLSGRLQSLASAGLVRKRQLPPPAASTVYELTDLGAGLRPVLLGLFQWGLQLLGTPSGEDTLRASYWLPAIQSAARPETLPNGIEDVYDFRIGEEAISVTAGAGGVEARQGPAESADVVIRTDHETFAALGSGRLSPEQALRSGRLTVKGDAPATERCAAIFAVAADNGASADA